MKEDTNDDEFSLEYQSEDLLESSEEQSEDFEFEPPEENKAKKLNVNNIFIVLFTSILLIILLIVSVSKITKSKKKESAELDKAGIEHMGTYATEEDSEKYYLYSSSCCW